MDSYQFSNHSLEQMQVRGITEEMVNNLFKNPGQRLLDPFDSGKMILQSIFSDSNAKMFLVRIFINVSKKPPMVITVYKTSKIDKYWNYESEI